jgi:hypothetical protein
MADTKALVAAFIDRLERRDWDGFAALLDPDVVYEVPQTRERIRGRDRYVQFNAEYPGDWHLAPKVVLGDDHDGCVLFEWCVGDDAPLPAVAFFEVDGDRITKITDLWPEPYEPPAGREHLTERW